MHTCKDCWHDYMHDEIDTIYYSMQPDTEIECFIIIPPAQSIANNCGQPTLPYGQPNLKVVDHIIMANCPQRLFLTLYRPYSIEDDVPSNIHDMQVPQNSQCAQIETGLGKEQALNINNVSSYLNVRIITTIEAHAWVFNYMYRHICLSLIHI